MSAHFGRHFLISLLAFSSTLVGQKQDYSNPELYAQTITPIELKGHVNFLASDELEGRLTGARGQKVAAKYIASQFQSYGLEAGVGLGDRSESYFQKFKLTKNKGISNTSYIKTTSGEEFKHMVDFICFSSSGATLTAEVLLLDKDGLQHKIDKSELEGKIVALYGESISKSYREFSGLAYKHGAKAFFYIALDPDEFEERRERMEKNAESQRASMSLVSEKEESRTFLAINDVLVEKIFRAPQEELIKQIKKKNYPVSKVSLSIEINREDNITSENVVGVLPGTDKKDEYIFITSHYDHEGVIGGKIYNGADDNASGTSAVLEIAEAFSIAASNGARPRRTIVFMTVSGEEKGLLGSEYYASHPIFPLEKTVADFNIDMVGRLDEKHENNENYIYLIGSDRLSKDLHEISEAINEKYTSLELDYTFNADDDPNRFYYRSDHYNFAKNNIPVIFYFNGVHDDYHQPTDTPDKILHKKIAHISTLIFHTIWEVANREDRIRLNGKDVKE